MDINEDRGRLQKWIDQSRHIVFFGGAGVSTESGIPDFRSPDGLYHQKYQYPPELIISHSFFMEHTEEFYRFYRDKMLFLDKKPNAAHHYLAALEKSEKLSCIITQNIDGLHQLAGSKNVVELHGSIHRNYCMNCHESYSASFIKDSVDIVPHCPLCGGVIKPDVVLYDEPLNGNDCKRTIDEIRHCDLLIVAGTSLAVYPACSFVVDFYQGNHLVLINKGEVSHEVKPNMLIEQKVGELFGGMKV